MNHAPTASTPPSCRGDALAVSTSSAILQRDLTHRSTPAAPCFSGLAFASADQHTRTHPPPALHALSAATGDHDRRPLGFLALDARTTPWPASSPTATSAGLLPASLPDSPHGPPTSPPKKPVQHPSAPAGEAMDLMETSQITVLPIVTPPARSWQVVHCTTCSQRPYSFAGREEVEVGGERRWIEGDEDASVGQGALGPLNPEVGRTFERCQVPTSRNSRPGGLLVRVGAGRYLPNSLIRFRTKRLGSFLASSFVLKVALFTSPVRSMHFDLSSMSHAMLQL